MTSPRIRSLCRAATVALAAAVGLTVAGGPAAAAEEEVVDGHLDWGFSASFRQYVSNGNGQPPISTTGEASINPDGTFRFPVTGGTFDHAAGTGTVHYGGAVVFSYPAHFFEITLANPTLVADAAGTRLLADVDLASDGGGFEPVHAVQAEVAVLDAGDPAVNGGTVSWTNLAATLTADGAAAFAGFYPAGTSLDPVSTGFSTDGAVAMPAVVVTPATGLDPDGATIEVTGSGFDPTSPGIYVVFGPQQDGPWWTDSQLFQTAVWVHPGGGSGGSQALLAPDGSFRTTLHVTATYTDGHGTEVDCQAVTCYVTTMRAHSLPDRSQDTFTPVSFGDAPVNGTAQQEITVEVAGGPLALAVAGSMVDLTATTIGGTATGQLHTATVEDLRGTDAGWSLVGQVGEFTSGSGGFAGDQLGWAPTAAASGGGEVVPGSAVDSGLGAAHTLCSAPGGASGGTFTCGAQLQLNVPTTAAPGNYRATLTLTLS